VAISTLLLMTMGFYLSYALNIFKEDKAADVYSITLSNSVSLGERLKLLIGQDLTALDDLDENPEKWKEWIRPMPNALVLECLSADGSYSFVLNEKKLSELLDSPEKLSFSPDQKTGQLLKRLSNGSVKIERSLHSGLPPHYTLLTAQNGGRKCALHVSMEKLMPLMNETLNYGTYILADNAQVFLKLNQETPKLESIKKILNDPTISSVQQGVKRFDESKGAVIRAFSKVAPFGLLAITEIEEEKAFLASTLLVNKSFFFGILILSIAVITGIIFTRRMTKNVQTLFSATTKMAEGDFNVNPVAAGNDEIGALTDSFVDMKDKIVAYMEEMKEKARIESELKVAQLVQNSFFPRHGLIKKDFSIEGMYTPASECSGDWWGFFEQQNKVTILVCDATGHGVPAALITAAAHSCVSTLKIDAETKVVSPKAALDKLNKVICSMNSDILMTAFVLEIDEEKKTITYSNASHMSPYLLTKIEKTYSKEGLSALIDNNGPRMGEKMDSTYSETTFNYNAGDRIVLFSDGIIEMEVDGKPWGQRNFLKSLYKNAHLASKSLIAHVWKDFKEFTGEHSVQDDVTLVAVSFGEKIPVLKDKNDVEQMLSANPDYILSELSNEDNIELLSRSKLNHLIGHNTLDFNSEFKIVQILENKEHFKLTESLDDSYKVKRWPLISNSQIRDTIQKMSQELSGDCSPAITEEVLSLVSEELLSNAFYHSCSEQEKTRGEQIVLIPGKEVEYIVAVNNDYVIVAVRGPSSFSSREKVIQSIKRGYEEKTPSQNTAGAGLGLYLIYENSQQFWVINSPASQGQIICVFEKFNRYKKAKERITSFHYLTKEII
jgi:sigma-B regulation protein RsbU (phosphoserine phosphatase)